MKWSSAAPPWFPPPKGFPTPSPGERKLHCGLFTFLPSHELRPKDIATIRDKLNVSQAVFAAYLGVKPSSVMSWEYGTRQPSGAARKLLSIARKNPKILVEA